MHECVVLRSAFGDKSLVDSLSSLLLSLCLLGYGAIVGGPASHVFGRDAPRINQVDEVVKSD